MGFLSKTYNRYRTGELRIEELSTEFVYDTWDRQIKVNELFELFFKKDTYHIVDFNINKPQFIRWSLRRRSRLSLIPEKIGNCFVITDPQNKTYICYNSYHRKLTSGKYDENMITNKVNAKTPIEKTIKYYLDNSPCRVINLTNSNLSEYKKIFKSINKIVNEYKEENKTRVDKWINNKF